MGLGCYKGRTKGVMIVDTRFGADPLLLRYSGRQKVEYTTTFIGAGGRGGEGGVFLSVKK